MSLVPIPARLHALLSLSSETADMPLDELIERIAEVVSDLLSASGLEKLYDLLYRLDVPEATFHAAMQLSDPAQIPVQLARLIVTREIQRQKTRAAYLKKYPQLADFDRL